MALTRNDIQILKEVLQPEFDKIHTQFEQIDKKFKQADERFNQIDDRFNRIDKRFDLIDKRFDEIDERFDQNDKDHQNIVTQLIAELYNLYTPRDDFNKLEKRVTEVETKLHG